MGCTGQPSESNRLPQETIPGFENLPEVLKMEVLLRLDPASLCCIACVNRPFRALANSILDDWRPQLIKKVQEAFRETVSQAAAAPTLVTLLMAGVVAYRDLPSWQRRDDRSLLAFCQRHAYATTNNSEWRVASHLISALVLGQHPVEHTSQNLLPAGNTPMDAYDKFYISLLVKLSITSYLMEKSMTWALYRIQQEFGTWQDFHQHAGRGVVEVVFNRYGCGCAPTMKAARRCTLM